MIRRFHALPKVQDIIRKHYIDQTKFNSKQVTQSIVGHPQHVTIDEFHLRGQQATNDLAASLSISPGNLVLDLGSGLGGPARRIANKYKCHVLGVEYLEEFIQTARSISKETNGMAAEFPELSRKAFLNTGNGGEPRSSTVWFLQGDLTSTDWHRKLDGCRFNSIYMQHVLMHLDRLQRQRLWQIIGNELLLPGGRFGLYDICWGSQVRSSSAEEPQDQLHFPLPFASRPGEFYLQHAQQLQQDITAAGLKLLKWNDQTSVCIEWLQDSRRISATEPQKPNMRLIMGRELAAQKSANLQRCLAEGKLCVVLAVFE
jgi:SAM-dependent methyltransferase